MKIEKYKNKIVLVNEKEEQLVIQYAGGDLYWVMLNYQPNNEFIISESDELMFNHLENIFQHLEDRNNINQKLLTNNTLEWISEAYGIPEEANRLTIKKENNQYIIKFYQNPNKIFNLKDVCSVCFCLSGSKYPDIASIFSIMLHECLKDSIHKTRILKQENKKISSEDK